jgi:hypothetical protein
MSRFLDQMEQDPAKVYGLIQPKEYVHWAAAVLVAEARNLETGSSPHDAFGSLCLL